MAMNDSGYRAAARRLEKAEGLPRWTALMRVFLVRLEEIELPAALESARHDAAQHWSGNPTDLVRLKVAVWEYIHANWASGTELASSQGRSARALLCVLEPDGAQEAYSMSAEWFAEMVDSR
jgi:hypothetical protein